MDLFDLPPSQPDALTLARRRYADAMAAFEAADDSGEGYDADGKPVSAGLVQELTAARLALVELERQAVYGV